MHTFFSPLERRCKHLPSLHQQIPTILLLVSYEKLGDFPLQSVCLITPSFFLSLAHSVTGSPANHLI